MKDSRGWTVKLHYFSNISGEDIQKKYNEFATNENTDMAATQIFQVQNPENLPELEELFNAFFYVKEKHGGVVGL